jgi:GTP pyrophosphokinase
MAHPSDDIIAAMRSPSTEDKEVIKKAYDFAEKAHGEEKRKSGEPYIIHPHSIAVRLAQMGMDRDTIVAGILHDTTEDTATTPEEIEKEFGQTVRFLVDGVTKLSKLKYRGLERHVESLRRLLVATASDIRVIIIKLMDRLHNMETLEFVEPVEKRLRIALETREVYVPIAERLGIGVVKAQLEDLAMKALDPDKYKETAAFLKERSESAKDALEDAKSELRKALVAAGMRTFRLESRVKNVHSFAKKLAKRGGDVDKIYDIFAIRVIVPTVEDCYRALGVIHALWRPLLGRVKDYIAAPKPNGYRSLHTTIITRREITIEIQIRSEDMQREAQFGVATHFNYKRLSAGQAGGLPSFFTSGEWIQKFIPSLMKFQTGPSGAAPKPRWLTDLVEVAKVEERQESFQQSLSDDFLAERMFVFTPKGDVIDLPVGASVVDFAYAIHSDVGNRMVGAKVDSKMVSLDTELGNGNIVEVVTKKSAKPSKKWLTYAKTAGAKHHIRSELGKIK